MANRFKETKGSFSMDEILSLFKSKDGARLCQQLMKEDPNGYREAQRQGREMGILGAGLRKYDQTPVANPNGPRVFSDAELSARQIFDEQTCRDYFKQGWSGTVSNTLAKLAKDRPEEYQILKLAAVSYDFLDPSSIRPTPPTKPLEPTVPVKSVLADDLARRANLPIGTMVTVDEFARINRNILEHEQWVDAEKVKAAKAAEAEAATGDK
jgi:hypothetical protein